MKTECKQCGKCCQNIILQTELLIDNVSKQWIELHNIEVVKIKDKTYLKINNQCTKLKDGKCTIYEERPFNCRQYKCEDNKEFL